MQIEDLIVEVRDANLARLGQLTTDDKEGLTLAARANAVGSWTIDLPDTVLDEATGREVPHALCAALRKEGAGIVITGPDGVILSGPTTEAKFAATDADPEGVWSITGVSDTILLQDALAYPDPATVDPAAQRVSNDNRQARAEDLIRQYVSQNIVSGVAPAGRIVGFRSKLTLQGVSQGRGPVLAYGPRFQNLLELVQEIAVAGGLLFDVAQNGAVLELRVWEPRDRSKFVRMDVTNQALASVEYGFGAPTATRPIVAGQGEGTDRTILERTSSAAQASETLWGRRIERFVDQRQTDDVAELIQKADTVLLEEGSTVSSMQVTPSDDLAMVFLRDWGLGDIVTVVVGAVETIARVTEAALKVDNGVLIGATVGDPEGFSPEDVQASRITSTEARVSALERNTDTGVRFGSIDPYYTAGLPRVKFDGDADFYPVGIPWAYPYSPMPGDRVVVAAQRGGGYVIQGMLIEGTSTMISLSATSLLSSSFSLYSGGAAPWKVPSFTKTADGIVSLSGIVAFNTSTAGDYLIFTLPPGFRPDYDFTAPASYGPSGTNALGRIRVSANGDVSWISSGAIAPGQYLSLAGIAFPAAGVATWTDVLPAGSGGTGAVFLSGWASSPGGAQDVVRYWVDPYGFVWWRGSIRTPAVSTDNTPMVDFRSAPLKPTLEVHHLASASGGRLAGVGSAGSANALRWKNTTAGAMSAGTDLSLGGIVMASAATDSLAWKRAAYINGWTDYGPSFPSVGYVNRNGLVMTRGLGKIGTANSNPFAVPAGYRPKPTLPDLGGAVILPRLTTQAFGRLDALPDGSLTTQQATASGWFSFDGGVWAAEQ